MRDSLSGVRVNDVFIVRLESKFWKLLERNLSFCFVITDGVRFIGAELRYDENNATDKTERGVT